MLYRVKQFFLALFSKITNEDKEFINRYLNDEDKKIFNRLPTHEKKHSLNVARYVLNHNKGIDDFYIRASILHDIGKINSGLNPIFKGIIVILNSLSEELTRKMQFIKPISVYYNHPSIGGGIYRDIDRDISYIIENHHNYTITDPIIKMIQEADSKN
ncbi:HD domain-containing protein [Clostridium cylindrosporum]|uniref:HD domain-containing protein n=1 Tax=Clostridium cylindrosporum DSM 605 TaxID=1121307 RepID=A0A0J8DDX0_CLOCY|nr:HD domain-containing protein [Clostridium cylindrosporum]KMT22418.1 hypothetical protein CLCY_14c00160 [Clostridium cylindrosporum DSM 605]